MSSNLIALQNRFLGHGDTIYDVIARHMEAHGAITDTDIDAMALAHNLPKVHVRSVVKFYDEWRAHDREKGPTIKVCIGEACQAAGGEKCRKWLEGSGPEGLEVAEVACLGYCGSGPNVMVGDEVRSVPSETEARRMCSATAEGLGLPGQEPVNAYHATKLCPQIVTARFAKKAVSLKEAKNAGVYEALNRVLKTMSPTNVIDLIKESQIRGRGGAGFPAGVKLATAAGVDAERRYVVCNADEGDAGAYIDKEIMERDPHNLLEGLLLAAYAIGADTTYIYVRHEYPRSTSVLTEAVNEAREAGLIGHHILGSTFSCEVRVVRGQGAYICGEETSLLRSLEGLPAQVSIKPPFPAVQGLFGMPTVVNNVETLANFPWIITHGGSAYAALGHAKSRGTKVVSVNSLVKRPGLYEVPLGITLRTILFDLCGGMKDGSQFRAVQVGGPLGGIFPESLLDTPLDFEAFGAAKGLLGHAGIVVFDDQTDLIRIGRNLMKFCAVESCGKCFPCRLGSVRGTELLDKVLEGRGVRSDMTLLAELCETLKYGSLCALGGAIPTPIENLMEYFPEEFDKLIPKEKVKA
ncbi:MAG: NADH-ubiquinone oxidoreductase-F iron-sulfur binding region domain-containing protein [Planctomycetota bacterium]